MKIIGDRINDAVDSGAYVNCNGGCSVCSDPAAWELEFGSPFPRLGGKRGFIPALCPKCGRQMRGYQEVVHGKRNTDD